jgi:hypothetical protein
MPHGAPAINTGSTLRQELHMAVRNLALPEHVETPPHLPVATRYMGPVLAAVRRHSGFQFIFENERTGEAGAWLGHPQRPS